MRKFENWIDSYIDFTQNLEAPMEYHLWAAISTIAGALRGKCYFNMGHFKWKPNFYIVFVAPPGIATKSTTFGIAMSLLREVKGINFGPDSVTWQALTQSLEENVEEQVVDGKAKKMSNLTVMASELGTFLDMDNRDMIDVLVDLWDGRDIPWVRRTRSGGETSIPSPWINIVAGTTPSWISSNMPEYAIGGGFTSRTLFIFADRKDKLIAYPSEVMDPGWQKMREELVIDLQKIAQISGEFKLSRQAYTIGKEWYENHWRNMPEHLREANLAGYAARKQTHLHKLCMVLSAAERDDKIITEKHFDRALTLLGLIERNMTKVFATISDDFGVKHMAYTLQEMKRSPRIEKKALFRVLSTKMTYHNFEAAVTAMINAGYVTATLENGSVHLTLDTASLSSLLPPETSSHSA